MNDSDPTEGIRRAMVAEINSDERKRAELEEEVGRTWTTDELTEEFEVLGFLAPFVRVVRRSDGKPGTMLFKHNPRFYFKFAEDPR